MQRIWTSEVASFRGEFVDFDDIWQWPKPIQTPYPPVLIAGSGPGTIDRVLEYGDGWMPMPNRGPMTLSEGLDTLRRQCEAAAREHVPVTIFGAAPDPRVIEDYMAQGVERCLFSLTDGPTDAVLRELDSLTKLIEQFT
jgi:alkanesulfonate monooxygenase SsuD/methylene tetrahydromethanopterin reductase-like flavin-dependent oxidoreductase (luciferase family)